ncbi:MAG TPA: TIGR02678 family protein [Longimicrobium sp.]|nr:TIGR02678 family protein [Longimicrobium sp.]
MIASDVARSADFRLCAEALIGRAIVTAADDRALLEKIRRHQPALQSAFGRLTGWRVQAHPEFARLVKPPARAESSHGLAWARGRLDYALLAWVLWYGEHTHGRKFTVSQIADEIKLRSAGPGDPGLDWTSRDQRLAARRVFRGLEEMGVLRLQDGSVEEWADENGKRDALYAWGAAAWRIHVGIPAAELERLAEGRSAPASPAPPADGTDEIRLYRTLLLNPALFRRDDPAAFRLLDAPETRARVHQNLKQLTSWELEVTPEYARVLRPARADDALQTPIPVTSGLDHAVLCFCTLLRERQAAGRLVPAGGECFLIDDSRVWQDVDELQKRFGAKWGKTLREQKVSALAEDVVAEMKAWGLMRDTDVRGQYLVLPTAARLAAHYGDDVEKDRDEDPED